MFRIGATSYVIPADILPNVEYLAPQVDDVELVLFETDEYGSNLPDAALRNRLDCARALRTRLTYTVHLPLDLRLGDEGDPGHISLVKAERVIAATRELAPFAYTVHLDGRPLMAAGPDGPDARFLAAWQANAIGALETVAGWLDDPARLCIENVEAWNPDAFAPVLDAAPVSRTADVGHLWLCGEDPLPRLAAWINRTARRASARHRRARPQVADVGPTGATRSGRGVARPAVHRRGDAGGIQPGGLPVIEGRAGGVVGTGGRNTWLTNWF